MDEPNLVFALFVGSLFSELIFFKGQIMARSFLKRFFLGGFFETAEEKAEKAEEQMSEISQEDWDNLSWRDQEMYHIIQKIESLKKRHSAAKSRAYLGMASRDSTMSNSSMAQMSSYEMQINQLNQTY